MQSQTHHNKDRSQTHNSCALYPDYLRSNPRGTEHPITGTIQPLPQFDECAKVIVAPAITTARDKKVPIKIANTTDFPYTIATDTKIAELQILNPEETKMIRPVDIAATNLLTEHDDVVTYINALMQ